MQDELRLLVPTILGARDFEEGAALTLSPMLRLAEEALDASPLRGRGRVVRGMIHLRPDDGYRQLVVLEAGSDEVAPPNPDEPQLPSTTAWRWVAERRCAIALDVNLGRLEIIEGVEPGAAPSGAMEGSTGVMLGSAGTRQRLLGRGATHVYTLPLRTTGGGVGGMISIEAECRAAIGQPFIWGACGSALQLLADVAAPHLFALPSRPADAEERDELLPVVGALMAPLVRMLRVFAQQEETVLLSGPTGAGKSRIARWCHARSPRSAAPFEVLDLSTVPEELQLGELFGWRKGAFTNALRDNPGAIGRAEGGTLFIDEIDKLSMRAQAALLQVLESRVFRALGDVGPERTANVRFLVGTNAHLQGEVRAQRFREDLYYRVNVLPVRLPPLRERPDEITLWARFQVERRHRERVDGGVARFDPAAERRLVAYEWPGNLRQLDNIVRRAYTLAVITHGGAPRHEIIVGDAEVARALAYEDHAVDGPLVESLERAATAFVREAERAAASGRTLDLDLADAFRGFVVGVAMHKTGSRDEAFRLLGREALVKSRNHHKVLRRELDRVSALCAAIGPEVTSPFADLDDSDKE